MIEYYYNNNVFTACPSSAALIRVVFLTLHVIKRKIVDSNYNNMFHRPRSIVKTLRAQRTV